jgi:hypothetical protein
MALDLLMHCILNRIDLILYAVVNLHRQTTTRTFLRTIETSKTKSRTFFATYVKSLCVSFDIYDERTIKIISACRGVTSLTFWVVPVTQSLRISTNQFITRPNNKLAAALSPLRPQRLSVLLHDVLCSPEPQFQLPFFENITHLAIVNRWEEWTAWSRFHLLPSLTHASFDFRVGPQSLDEAKASMISHAVDDVLASCTHLRVCVLLLLFDHKPIRTVQAIMKHMIKADSRLVFLRDTEPFRDREAHSTREAEIWELAEETVKRQRSGSGLSLFKFFSIDCTLSSPTKLEHTFIEL